MDLTKLKECPQELWLGDYGYSSEGICYYMSEYVRENIWGVDVKTYKGAIEAAKKAIPATIIKAGKAKNLRDRGGDRHPQDVYVTVPANLAAYKVYRVGLWFGDSSEAPATPATQNHEAVVITGQATDVVFFEPNFGFYHASEDGTTLKDVFESAVNSLYGPDSHAENFHYQRERSVV